jgi:hypothetical protein
VIFDLNGEAFVMRIDRWTLGDGPRLQYAVEFEAEIIVKARGGVFWITKRRTSDGATVFSPLGSAVLLKSRLA